MNKFNAIDINEYEIKSESSELEAQDSSDDLGSAIQKLIQRLRDNNPIKQFGF